MRGLTAVITGGSGQLGRTMAQALAQAGVQVAVVSLHTETAGTVAEAIQTSGGQALGIACDVLDRVALERTLAKAAVANFTQWLAVHMAQEYSPRIRVMEQGHPCFLLIIDSSIDDAARPLHRFFSDVAAHLRGQ